MLSHVRKSIERAVIYEIDEIFTPDSMKFRFQRAVNTPKEVIEVVEVLIEEVEYLVPVLEWKEAYYKLVRELLIGKLETIGVPQDLLNQIIIFLAPLIVKTAGDVTRTIAVLITGL